MPAPGWLSMGDPAWLSLGDPGWLCLPDPGASLGGSASIVVDDARPVGHEAPGFHILLQLVQRRKPRLCGEVDDPRLANLMYGVACHDKRFGPAQGRAPVPPRPSLAASRPDLILEGCGGRRRVCAGSVSFRLSRAGHLPLDGGGAHA